MIGGAVRERVLARVNLKPEQVVRKLAGARVPLPIVILVVQGAEQELAVTNVMNAWRSSVELIVFSRDEAEALRLAGEIQEALHGAQWVAAGLEVRQVRAVRGGESYTEDDGLHSAIVQTTINYRVTE